MNRRRVEVTGSPALLRSHDPSAAVASHQWSTLTLGPPIASSFGWPKALTNASTLSLRSLNASWKASTRSTFHLSCQQRFRLEVTGGLFLLDTNRLSPLPTACIFGFMGFPQLQKSEHVIESLSDEGVDSWDKHSVQWAGNRRILLIHKPSPSPRKKTLNAEVTGSPALLRSHDPSAAVTLGRNGSLLPGPSLGFFPGIHPTDASFPIWRCPPVCQENISDGSNFQDYWQQSLWHSSKIKTPDAWDTQINS